MGAFGAGAHQTGRHLANGGARPVPNRVGLAVVRSEWTERATPVQHRQGAGLRPRASQRRRRVELRERRTAVTSKEIRFWAWRTSPIPMSVCPSWERPLCWTAHGASAPRLGGWVCCLWMTSLKKWTPSAPAVT